MMGRAILLRVIRIWNDKRRNFRHGFQGGYTPPDIKFEHIVFHIAGTDFREGIPRLISILSTLRLTPLVRISGRVCPA